MLYACGWQEPDSIPSNVVIRKKKNDQNDYAAAACYCGAYPIDGAYYSDAPLFDGADGADAGDAGGCGGIFFSFFDRELR